MAASTAAAPVAVIVREPLLALVGPTASGKTEAAIPIAEALGAEIVCIDSMLVYRGMDIGTAKPTEGQRQRVPHHLVDLVDPVEPFSVARFQHLAREAMADIQSRGTRALLVGSGGLYYRAVVDGLEFPGTVARTRALLQAEADLLGPEALHRRLEGFDPEAARKIDPSNERRTIRALEVAAITARPFSAFARDWDTYTKDAVRAAGIDLPRAVLHRRIEQRVLAMMPRLLDETRRLLERGFGSFLTSSQAIGYAEAAACLEARVSQGEAAATAARRTKGLARRQMAWLRRDPRVRWFAAGEEGALEVVEEIEAYLRGDQAERRPGRSRPRGSRRRQMQFSKYHGTGNDFVLIEDVADRIRLNPEMIAALCDRRRGVGADGLIRIAPAPDADFFMDYYNAEGEPAEMCGNGIRCLAKYVFDRELTSFTELDVLTRAGLKHLVLDARDGAVRTVTVDMGPPAFERKAIPMVGEPTETFIGQQLQVDGRTFTATALSMGNPHVVLFVDPTEDLAAVPVATLGPSIEVREEFPNRTNVEFIQPTNGRIRMRVWERGVGETMACGTGACASLAASVLAGLAGRTAEVEFPGGLLEVRWREDDDHFFLTGPAVCVYDGELDERWLHQASEGAVR